MSDAQAILRMIEKVPPDDTAKLAEIDARVHIEFFPQWTIKHNYPKPEQFPILLRRTIESGCCPKYTRSRDALKKIRPQQGHSLYRMFTSDSWDMWQCQIAWYPTTSTPKYCTSPHLPTEELAELHAIIQAIDYERKQ